MAIAREVASVTRLGIEVNFLFLQIYLFFQFLFFLIFFVDTYIVLFFPVVRNSQYFLYLHFHSILLIFVELSCRHEYSQQFEYSQGHNYEWRNVVRVSYGQNLHNLAIREKGKKGEPHYVMKGRRINIKGITVLCLCSGYYLVKGIVNSKVGSQSVFIPLSIV